jgi:serine/threonine protein kinase
MLNREDQASFRNLIERSLSQDSDDRPNTTEALKHSFITRGDWKYNLQVVRSLVRSLPDNVEAPRKMGDQLGYETYPSPAPTTSGGNHQSATNQSSSADEDAYYSDIYEEN